MTKELQNSVWSILPKEFKEEVKKLAQYYSRHVSALFGMERQRADKFYCEFVSLFGKHNLTSDAEGEELLTVPRNKVQELYAKAKDIYDLYTNATCINSLESHAIDISTGKMKILDTLFGSKCLPDIEPKPAGPKYKVGDKVRISCAFSSGEIWDSVLNGRVATIAACYRESNNWIYCFEEPIRDFAEFWLEPCTEPGNYMGDAYDSFNHIADVSKMMGYTIIYGIDETDRLHVAAMAMQGMLAAGEDYSGDCTFIVKKSFEIADALIARCKKE